MVINKSTTMFNTNEVLSGINKNDIYLPDINKNEYKKDVGTSQ